MYICMILFSGNHDCNVQAARYFFRIKCWDYYWYKFFRFVNMTLIFLYLQFTQVLYFTLFLYYLFSAKDLASRRSTMRKSVKRQNVIEKSIDPFENLENSLTPMSSQKMGDRHWTISGLKTRLSFKKSASFNASSDLESTEVPGYIRRKDRSITGSIFYDDENMSVTKSVSEPADFEPLDLKQKSMNELLSLLSPVRTILFLCVWVCVLAGSHDLPLIYFRSSIMSVKLLDK